MNAVERLLVDGEAAGALLECMYAQEMWTLRCATPLVRDCVDMHVAGKVLPLRPSPWCVDDFLKNFRRRQHMRCITVTTSGKLQRIDDLFPAVTTVYFTSDSLQYGMGDWRRGLPLPAWTQRVTCLELQELNVRTSEQLAALPRLRRLCVKDAPMRSLLSLHACTALRELCVENNGVQLVPTVPAGQLEQVHVIIDWTCAYQWLTHARATIDAMRGVRHVILEGSLWYDDLDLAVLQEAVVVEFRNISNNRSAFYGGRDPLHTLYASLSSLQCCQQLVLSNCRMHVMTELPLPTRLTHFTVRAPIKELDACLGLSDPPVSDMILAAMRSVPHVVLEYMTLGPTWVAALAHTETLSLSRVLLETMPTAAQWAAFTNLRTLDLHVHTLYNGGGGDGDAFLELHGLPASTRVRLSAADMHNGVSWPLIRDQVSARLFDTCGISAVPI